MDFFEFNISEEAIYDAILALVYGVGFTRSCVLQMTRHEREYYLEFAKKLEKAANDRGVV